MTLEVYLDPCTVNSRKVLAGLDHMGTSYNLNFVDYFAGGHKSPEYLKINPNATVPAMTHGDLTLTESNAILQYAAEIGKNPAYPVEVKQRADVSRWLLWEASAWFPSCYTYLVEYVVKPLLKTEPDQAVIDEAAPRWHRLAGILDTQLGKTRWLCGSDVTIADFAVAAPMHLHAAQRLPLDQHPNLTRWLGQVEALPAWKSTQAAVDKALLPGKQAAESMATEAAMDKTSNGTSQQGHQVRTKINYSKQTDKPTELYFYESDAAKGVHEPGDDLQQVTVTDGWHRADEFSIDKEGFALRSFKTSFDNWEDEAKVKSSFYPEVVDFLKQTVGAKRVLVFDHTIRTAANQGKKLTQETNTSQRSPVMLVHCDYTAESGPVRVKQLLPDEAAALLQRRVAFINVWKPLKGVVQERPLAMADVTSTPAADFFKLHLRYRERDGENYVLKYSPAHRWYYFDRMTPQHVVLLKTYDSETDGRARFVGHTAFEDPNTPPDAPMRESVEIRTIAFF